MAAEPLDDRRDEARLEVPQGVPRLPPPAPRDASIDDRIAAAERRLLAREAWLRQGLQTLNVQAREAVQPRRHAKSLLGLAAALAGLAWWWMRRRGAHPPRLRAASAGPAPAPRHAGLGDAMLQMLPLALPLLPAAWRQRISPGAATALATVAVSLGQKLWQRPVVVREHADGEVEVSRGAMDGAVPAGTRAVARVRQPMPRVDLARFAGTWHELARLPQPFEASCRGIPTATYRLSGAGYAVANRCLDRHGRERVARGVARVVPGRGGAVLRVSVMPVWLRWLPFAWSDLAIYFVDRDYRYALAGHPTRAALWILARSPQVPEGVVDELVERARDAGFPVGLLKRNHPV